MTERSTRRSGAHRRSLLLTLFALLISSLLLNGCGAGGYAGTGIVTVSASKLTIDAGQSVAVNVTTSGNQAVRWTITSSACTGAGCGVLSSSTATSTTYTAPATVSTSFTLTLQAELPGTKNSKTVAITVNPAPAINAPPPAGTVGVSYSTTFAVTGGTMPGQLTLLSGTLPPGLTFNASTGVVSGTPTASGTYSIVLQSTDTSDVPDTVTATEQFVIAEQTTGTGSTLTFVPPTLPGGVVGTTFSTTLQASGGSTPYTWAVVTGSLPAGLSLNAATGVISGTPSAQGTFSFTVQVQDAAGAKAHGSLSIIITAANSAPATLVITTGALPNGTVGVPYSAGINASGGIAPYSCALAAGTLPAGLSLNSSCAVSGTPTAAGTATLSITVTDAANPVDTITSPVTLVINAAAALTLASPPTATTGTPYTGSISVTGGIAPYTCTLASGTLPAGLTLASNCSLSGTPTTAGTSNIGITAKDSGSPVATTTGSVTITVNAAPAALVLGTLPNGTVNTPYSATLGVSGGVGPYVCTVTSGTLPTGVTLGSNCLFSGTPTVAGTSNLSVKATDASNPAMTGTDTVAITIAPASLLSLTTPPPATTGVPYTGSIGVSGGTAPYTCALAGGSLPTGLTLGSNCVISGTPIAGGTSTVSVTATDSSSPANTTTGSITITVNAAPATLVIGTLPNGTVGKSYSATLNVSGGVNPYTCTIAAGTLPAGLTLGANCVVSGTPTVAGAENVTVKATDASTPAVSTTGNVALTIAPAVVLSLTAPPAATVGAVYTGSIGVSGGTAPYSCTITAGSLPQGLSLGNHCAIMGTPATAGSTALTVQATDSSDPANSASGQVTLTVNAAPTTLTVGNPPAATVSTPYTGTIPVMGGTAPYNCIVSSGTLPAGLSLGSGCALTGTPTAEGSTTLTIAATDSASPANTTSSMVTITVNGLAPLTFTGSLPNAVVNQPYTQSLSATGGLAPYSYAVTSGTLPAGLNMSSDGTLSGTPTTVGAYSFTITGTDSEGTPQTKSLPLVLLVTYAPTASDTELTGPYAFLFQGYDDALAGVLAYQTATVGSFTADGSGVVSAGELDANHQTSTATGNTISTQPFLGTYTVGTDGRGLLTLSSLNADGTVAATHTYTLALKAPTAPATTATQGSMIEYDGNQLTGTRGSGTLLAQQTTAFATGLAGSYAFGLQGDTPCTVSCGLNLSLFGPAVQVGQFTVNAGALSGTADANIAAGNFPQQTLTGSTGAADGNGRLQVTMTTGSVATGVYPTDYAVYVVNASQAFILSTDKHSAYILLSGQAQAQTQAIFSNASATGPYVGYENSPTNPGLVGQVLQNVADLSTATIFEGNGDGVGTCTTNSVTQAGVTALVNQLTGVLGGVLSTLQGVLGAYTYTGTSACSVAANGREVLNYVTPYTNILGVIAITGTAPAPRVAYLYGPNQGFFLETGYAGLGRLEQQSGAPFSLGTLNSTVVYGTSPAASVASINASGVVAFNGNGTATAMLDENVGVGTLNVLELGNAATYPYSLTSAPYGTYLLGATDVIYAISPTRSVLVDTNVTTTSPAVALLY